MTVNTDAVFFIGDTHKTCEDYALAGDWNGIPYLIVSDGCSSSEMTDVGSRILAHAAKANLIPFFSLGYEAYGKAVIQDADNICRRLGLDTCVLDATLIVCFQSENGYKVYMYGDGCVMTCSTQGNCIDIIEFASGAPFYLSYWLDKQRLQGYTNKFNDLMKWIDESGNVTEFGFNAQIVIEIPEDGLESIVLGTDGLQSFYPKPGVMGAPKPLANFGELMAFKNKNGDFMHRRASRWIAALKKQGIYHGDDIGMAALTITE